MECPICTNTTNVFSVSTRCLHGACKDCIVKLSHASCHICRDPHGATRIDINATDYDALLGVDEAPRIEPFDVLFSDKYKATYEAFKNIISSKWENSANYTFSSVCGVCILLSQSKVDITLLTLFYACAPITRTTVLDAMTCMSMLYGLRKCNTFLTPIGTFFHFFMNHCTTPRGILDGDQSDISDFVTKIMHALVYDVPEVDALSNFITTVLTSEAIVDCPCNEAQLALETVCGRRQEDEEDNDGQLPFVPDEADEQLTAPVVWANSYKWEKCSTNKKDIRGEGDEDISSVNYFTAFTDCSVCNEMMNYALHDRLKDMDRQIQFNRKCMNVATAISVVCDSFKRKADIEDMINHYTDPICELNRHKFIHFYSLVKQPHSLIGKSGVPTHLLSELFSSKRSHVCPTFHLACFSHKLISADESQLKKTKRDSIQKWAHKIIRRHRQTVVRITERKIKK